MRRACLLIGLVLAALLLLATGLVWGTRPGRAAVKTILLVEALVPAVDIGLQERFTPEPLHERVSFPTPGGLREGDLYHPRGLGPHPAVLLFLGVAPAGADDPRVVNLGSALARSGIAVLWYWSPAFAAKRIDEREVENIVAAFQYLQGRPEVDRRRVGLGGFCVGASFVLLAAAREPIRRQVAYVNAFGPYFDARDVLRAVATRTRFNEEGSRPWGPDPLTWEVFARHLLEAVPDPGEAALLRRAFLEGGALAPGPAGLSPQGAVAYRLLAGVPTEEVDVLLAALPAPFLERLARISPAGSVREVVAPVFVMHDRADPLIPSEESQRLAAARRATGLPTHFTEFNLFEHVTPGRSLNPLLLVGELLKLVRHLYAVLVLAG